ncbi:MAG: methionyl-tRNA formyltransferase [Deferribacteraceae bacterium]|jgi:methionyl-tRNA formyltransferase|nr:methionyl-tRNA formyltransferase [Deferribacteraceae bacterium]
MRIIFFGTPEIAVPPLAALTAAGFDIPLVISQPDKPKGRGNIVHPTPVKKFAGKHGIEVYQPEKIRNNPETEALLKSLEPDFFAVAAYGKILPPSILAIPKYAPINLHYSLLPAYRGAAPVNWAILNGNEFTGVTSMKMDEGMDTGDILLAERVKIGKKDAVLLGAELAEIGGALLVKTIREYKSITPAPQGDNATTAPLLNKEMGLIDWRESAVAIERKIRAFLPWPSAYTYLDGRIFKIFAAEAEDEGVCQTQGEIKTVGKTSFDVMTGVGILRINEVQLEGKRRMSVCDFLAGYKLKAGDKLG